MDQSPHLDVPGLVEFLLTEKHVLGLMPNDGIARIICPALPHPSEGQGIPRCELYMIFEKLDPIIQRLERLQAPCVSPIKERDWGHRVAYFSDLDGHVLAIAEEI